MFGKVQNFSLTLSTIIIELNRYFTFSLALSHLIERDTQANKNQNIVKRSNGYIRTIEIVLILFLLPVPFLTQTSLSGTPTLTGRPIKIYCRVSSLVGHKSNAIIRNRDILFTSCFSIEEERKNVWYVRYFFL